MTAAADTEFLEGLRRALGSDYRVDRMIGEGGFGRVYAATDVRLGRDVAIKVIRPELAGARAFLDRFRKEGTALAKFRHPGIVPIYDIREQDGLIYYVMPLIEGETLRTKLEQRSKLAPKETQRILIELCDCLAATHRAGIVHRDIKPDNIILEGFFNSALLMDFGIAKSIEDYSATISGMMLGTPTYMSPEQASGDELIDHRSDIYSLGVLGYHMLTGRPPFVGRTAHQVIAGHVSEKPQPIRKLNPSVPKMLADAMERCLEKEPEDRFQTAMQLSEVLQQVTFGIEAERVAPETRNYAMPFFAGLALACDVVASLGVNTIAALSTRELWYFTGGFALLAMLTSPIARAATEPLSEEVLERIARWRGRLRLRNGS
ncbi:MAG: serine/threonine-protein kinase [Gemmatimonadaceae bacterium]